MIKTGINRSITYVLIATLTWSPLISVAGVPVPSSNFASDGSTLTTSDNVNNNGIDMVVDQASHTSVYNWDSFNIGANDSVTYNQPSSDSNALNYIHQHNASQIDGSLTANGNIYLINQNGIMFGDGASVNVGSLVASSLNIDEDLLQENGFVTSMEAGLPLFQAAVKIDDNGYPDNPSQWTLKVSGDIEVAQGAEINTASGGRVVLAGANVNNYGKISSPDGQVIVAATGKRELNIAELSDEELATWTDVARDELTPETIQAIAQKMAQEHQVYFAASSDPDLRGLLVEINAAGDASFTNEGDIVTERGNISILAMAINQQGTLRATTSEDVNGTIRLLAREQVQATNISGNTNEDPYYLGALNADEELELDFKSNQFAYMAPTRTGSITLGDGSVTEVVADQASAGETAPDAQEQRTSFVEMMGKDITLESGSEVRATSGTVDIAAVERPGLKRTFSQDPEDESDPGTIESDEFTEQGASLVIESGAVIDVSGSDATVLDMSRNVLEIDLQSNELRDSPLQRDGVLRGKTVYVDLRGGEEIAIADISAAVELIERPLSERLSKGGSVNIISTGSVDFQDGATIDVSGGTIEYRSGFVRESQLVSNGQLINISDADPLRSYQAVLNENERYNETWGVIERYDSFQVGQRGEFVEGYREGKSAGAVNIIADPTLYQHNGTILADAYVGPYQREGVNDLHGGTLSLNFELAQSGIADIAIVMEKEYRKILSGELQREEGTLYLSDSLLENSVNSASILSNAGLTLVEGANLQLDGGGDLKLGSFNRLTVAGDITNHGGNVSLKADEANSDDDLLSSILVSEGAVIDTSGRWVNDFPSVAEGTPDGQILIDGGKISLSASGSVNTEAGSLLKADGGARLTASGRIRAGKGGDIALAAGNFNKNASATLTVDGDMQSYGLRQGGTLSLTDREIKIAGSDPGGDVTYLDENFFTRGGFSGYSLNAGEDGVRIGDQGGDLTDIRLLAENYRLPHVNDSTSLGASYRNVASGASLSDLADIELLHPALRDGVGLKIASSDQLGSDSSILLADNVRLVADPGSVIQFSSEQSIDIHGAILNQGGEVSLTLGATDNLYEDDQAIRLFDGSLIDVSAVAVQEPAFGSQWDTYRFHDAGSVNLTAVRGYVLAESGAQVLANGQRVDIENPAAYLAGTSNNIVPESVALSAGDIRLQAAEGILFEGSLQARAADVAGERGGSLDMVLYSNERFDVEDVVGATGFSEYPLTVAVEDRGDNFTRVDTEVMTTSQISHVLNQKADTDSGTAYLDVGMLAQGGFDRLTLRAINSSGVEIPNPTEVASIRFDTDTALAAEEAIILDAPSILLNGHSASIETNYLALGTTTSKAEVTRAYGTQVAGGGVLNASANYIDLSGSLEFSDAEELTITSQNDIRLVGRSDEDLKGVSGDEGKISDRTLPTGSLTAFGDLDLNASQIVPLSATSYSITLQGAESTLTTSSTSAAAPVLSALGSITINAANVDHRGVIKAPFGQINIHSEDSLNLHPGSILSVSGENQIVPFGRVEADGAWLYDKVENEPLIVDQSVLLNKGITLEGAAVNHQKGATVDISGGGDLMGYQWTKGLGGSQDVLSNGFSENQFAVLPDYGNGNSGLYGAYDQLIGAGTNIQPGTTVYLDGGNGLAAGEYAVLPARYALLPGAYLVTVNGASGDTLQGISRTRVDGAPIVAGRFGFANGGHDSRWTPFVIEPGSVAFQRSDYGLHYASEYYAADEFSGISLPQDAGRLSLQAYDSLSLAGAVLAEYGNNGKGGAIDISATDLTVVSELDGSASGIQLLDDDLNALNVDSILLGGVRTNTDSGVSIAVGADTVTFAEDTSLILPELLATAKQQLYVNDNASIEAASGSPGAGGHASIQGGGAFLQVSDGGLLNVARTTGAPGQGNLTIAENARLNSSGSLVVEGSGSVRVLGELSTSGAAGFIADTLALGSSDGAAPPDGGMQLSRDQLADVGAREYLFKARDNINFAGEFDLQAGDITLDTPLITGSLAAGQQASLIASGQMVLTNNSGASEGDLPGNAALGELQLGAARFLLGETGLSSVTVIDGFEQVNLGRTGSHSGEAVTASGAGDYTLSATGHLTLDANQVSVESRGRLKLEASGNLQLVDSLAAMRQITAMDNRSLGTVLELEGDNVHVDTRLQANSGYMGLQAQHQLTLGNQAELDLSGITRTFGTQHQIEKFTDGGQLNLVSVSGDISLAQGSVVNLAGGGGNANGGQLRLSALQGTAELNGSIIGQNDSSANGSSFHAVLGSLADSHALLTAINNAGFNRDLSLELVTGDIDVNEGASIAAEQIKLHAEGGSVNIAGQLTADRDEGGLIHLASRDQIQIAATGSLTATGEQGGDILLEAQYSDNPDAILFANGASLDVSARSSHAADNQGVVEMITANPETGTRLAIQDNGVDVIGAESVILGIHQSIDSQVVNQQLISDAIGFFDPVYNNHDSMISQLDGLSLLDNVSLRPVLEVYSSDNLTVNGDVNLADFRFGESDENGSSGDVGKLVLRSENDIAMNADLWAGVKEVRATVLAPGPVQISPIADTSWGISLIAGAEVNSATLSKVNDSKTGDITLAMDKSLVTGTGDIELYAAGDVTLDSGASVKSIGRTVAVANNGSFPLYDTNNQLLDSVADYGTLDKDNLLQHFSSDDYYAPRRIFYGYDGGDIDIHSGGDLTGNGISQAGTEWRYRISDEFEFNLYSNGEQFNKFVTTWGIAYENFTQGIGTLGGGNINLESGGTIQNLNLAAPTVARQIGRNPSDGVPENRVDITGGGNINVVAADDINTMAYLVSDGDLNVDAGGSIGIRDGSNIASLITYGSADIAFKAIGSIELTGAISEFMTPMSPSQTESLNQHTVYWVEEGASSELDMISLAGDVHLDLEASSFGAIRNLYGNRVSAANGTWNYYSLLPETLSALAFSDSIYLESDFYIKPSTTSNMELLAQQDIAAVTDDASVSQIKTALTNYDSALLPGRYDPIYEDSAPSLLGLFRDITGQSQLPATGRKPVLTDTQPAVLIAREGNIDSVLNWTLELGKKSYLEAGNSILNPSIYLQNNSDTDVSRVVAGNDVLVEITRNPVTGALTRSGNKKISIAGEGALVVQAGNDVSLGASSGIRSTGNGDNVALPETGADIYVLAGIKQDPETEALLMPAIVRGMDITVADLEAAGIETVDTSDPVLPDNFTALAGDPATLTAGEKALLNLTPVQQQQVTEHLIASGRFPARDIYVYQQFYSQLVQAGEDSAEEGAEAFDQGFAVIDALFPGSGEKDSPWDGDISLIFSTLQTEDGGDVHFLTPGGGVDVGLPTTLLNKKSAELGIFAKTTGSVYGFSDQDINVNQSRIFTLDGGDILLWSSNGNIDAGKGAKTALTIPPVRVTYDENGNSQQEFPPAIDGSGIGGFVTPGRDPGNVYLLAPRGYVDAGDAGIRVKGDFIAGGELLNEGNLDVGGVSVGVPVNSGISASVAGLGGLAGSATDGATENATGGADNADQAQTAFLTVEIIGLGE